MRPKCHIPVAPRYVGFERGLSTGIYRPICHPKPNIPLSPGMLGFGGVLSLAYTARCPAQNPTYRAHPSAWSGSFTRTRSPSPNSQTTHRRRRARGQRLRPQMPTLTARRRTQIAPCRQSPLHREKQLSSPKSSRCPSPKFLRLPVRDAPSTSSAQCQRPVKCQG